MQLSVWLTTSPSLAMQPGPGTDASVHEPDWQVQSHGRHLLVGVRGAAGASPKTILLAPGGWCWGHEVGSEEPWVEGFYYSMFFGSGAVPYHPNAAGHYGVGEELFRRIKEEGGEAWRGK